MKDLAYITFSTAPFGILLNFAAARRRKRTATNEFLAAWGVRLAWFFIFIATGLVFSTISLASGASEAKRVLILYSFKYGLSGNALMDGNQVTSHAIQTTMQAKMPQKLAFHSERMSVSDLPESRYFEELRDTYRKKYRGQPIDLIIAVHYRALKFLITHGAEIWPDIPIIFSGVEEGRREQLEQVRPNITGIFANARFGDMLDTVLKIHPDIKQMTMIVGASETERFIETRIRNISHKYDGKVNFVYLSDLGFDEILDNVSDLPQNSVAFFLTLLKDGQGKPVPENSLHLISRVSNVPVYGLFDVYVGHGIVGGSLYSVEHRGVSIGKLGLRILEGEKPEDIPMGTEEKHFDLYDWRQIKRWGISERDLPPGGVVRYRNPTFYETYKWYIWGGIALILLEALLIVHLLINRARRRRVEKMLKEREQRLREVMASRAFLQNEVKHLDRVATMGTLTASIAHEIGQPLAAILSNAQAAIRFMDMEQPDLGEAREALDDIVINDKRAAEVIQRLRGLLKKSDPKLEILHLDAVAQEVVDLLRSEIVLINASVMMDTDKKTPAAQGDRVQIQQVILNLLVNALDATRTRPEDSREIRIFISVDERNGIMFSVSDTGPGIEGQKLETIFETFHTTKDKGMGMGLSICKSIIDQHNGRIWAVNKPEQGAEIIFTLPIMKDDKR
jgi:signal transduction histidine kinase/ABC-type uncharacterized transport system substrate-binding protein